MCFSFHRSLLLNVLFRKIQALLDIQEFYELTLMDESKTNAIKASEAIEMASRWEVGQGPFGKPMVLHNNDPSAQQTADTLAIGMLIF